MAYYAGFLPIAQRLVEGNPAGRKNLMDGLLMLVKENWQDN
jgi:hypothetical protein